ncbi:unnamed protein product [Brugia pahangi]|uniref:Uncharacterized protein n=1 Tax=Brugia pahangi TaxID=6280 RepID=A0A0N4T9J7_BRUPA|nr:unnamed protein product [Brugia pahangi]
MSLERPEETANGALLSNDEHLDEAKMEKKNDMKITDNDMKRTDNLQQRNDQSVLAFNKLQITNHGCTGDSRRSKLLFLWKYLTLRGLFRLLGKILSLFKYEIMH